MGSKARSSVARMGSGYASGGSRHGDDNVANLWLNEGKPKLNWHWASNSLARWGSASCGSKLKLKSRNLKSLESRVLELENKMVKIEKVIKL